MTVAMVFARSEECAVSSVFPRNYVYVRQLGDFFAACLTTFGTPTLHLEQTTDDRALTGRVQSVV